MSIVAAEALASNYWSVLYENNVTELTHIDLTAEYLIQVQSWYQLAYRPDAVIEFDLVRPSVLNRPNAYDVLDRQWTVNDGTVRQWGNVPFGTTTGYNNLYTNQQVAYCATFREFEDRDDLLTVTRAGDYWTDYRFIFIIGTSLGAGYTIDTYNWHDDPPPPAPEWLLQADVNGNGFYRNTIVDPNPNDGNAGRVIIGECSLNVAATSAIP